MPPLSGLDWFFLCPYPGLPPGAIQMAAPPERWDLSRPSKGSFSRGRPTRIVPRACLTAVSLNMTSVSLELTAFSYLLQSASGATASGSYLLRRLPQDPDQLLFTSLQFLRRPGLQNQPQKGLGVRRPHVRPPVGIAEGDAVEVIDLGVGVAAGELVHLSLLVLHLEVDLRALGVAP